MATRFVKASLSAVGAALWWLADKLWGDRVFAWLRPMIPTWMAEPVVSDWIESALSYGPFVALILLAIYFFWTGKRESRQPTTENWQDELSISPASRMLIGLISTPTDGAAVWMAPHWPIPAVMAGSRMTAARVTRGAISLSSSSHFALVAYSSRMKPVALPP